MKKWLAAFAAALGIVACTKSSTSSTTPTTPSTKSTDTFSGTVAVKGTDAHNFTVNSSGEVDVTLTVTNPSVTMGLSVGVPNGSACPAIGGGSVVANAGSTAQLSGVLSPATYCVAVFDIGNQSQSVSYTVTVAHF